MALPLLLPGLVVGGVWAHLGRSWTPHCRAIPHQSSGPGHSGTPWGHWVNPVSRRSQDEELQSHAEQEGLQLLPVWGRLPGGGQPAAPQPRASPATQQGVPPRECSRAHPSCPPLGPPPPLGTSRHHMPAELSGDCHKQLEEHTQQLPGALGYYRTVRGI